ncbi:MAG: hypothetical protein IPK68_09670 [Bdellovibrionales bacterium]|nr:hypothetical protein [Bdellovibrionales bacterium]
MKSKKLINAYPFVEMPDPKIRYLIRDEKLDPLAVLWFEDSGTPNLRYLREVSPELEPQILRFMNDRQRLLFG